MDREPRVCWRNCVSSLGPSLPLRPHWSLLFRICPGSFQMDGKDSPKHVLQSWAPFWSSYHLGFSCASFAIDALPRGQRSELFSSVHSARLRPSFRVSRALIMTLAHLSYSVLFYGISCFLKILCLTTLAMLLFMMISYYLLSPALCKKQASDKYLKS